jgi:hypothetical protein
MAGYEADDELTGREPGNGLGAQAPPPDGPPGPPAESTDSGQFEFVTEYVERDGEGFGWLLGPGSSALPDEPPAAPKLPAPPPPIDDFGDEAAIVRPYAWTRGRTRANYDLKLETLISTTDLGQDDTRLAQLEHREVSQLCRYPLSVAEVAAKLSIPLGVARVILSDMAELGLISIHRTFADDDIAAHLVLMERVLSGLRRL